VQRRLAQRLVELWPRERQVRPRLAGPVQPATAYLAAARPERRVDARRRAGKSAPAFVLEVAQAPVLSKARPRAVAWSQRQAAALVQASTAQQQVALQPAGPLPAERLSAQISSQAVEAAVAQPFSAPAVARISEVAAAQAPVAVAALPSAAAESTEAEAEAERHVPAAAEALRQVAAAGPDAVAAEVLQQVEAAARQEAAEAEVLRPAVAVAAERDAAAQRQAEPAVRPPEEALLSAAVSVPASSGPAGPWRRPRVPARAPERE
jgi:hypothetical protein